jgi:intein-encoded DNA endonuclease-like protein
MANKRTMEIEEMINLYLDGHGTTEIAELASVTPRYVRLVLSKNNIEKRPFGHWKRQYQLNEDYFKTWTNNMAYPYVPEEYLSHFIRGYFDGDGCIYENKNFVNIVGGSLDFMESLMVIFSKENFNPILKTFDKHYRVYISGIENIKRFSSWIYQDKELFLQRKYNRFYKI